MKLILGFVVLGLLVLLLLFWLLLWLLNRIARAQFRKEVEAAGYSYTAGDPAMLERFQAPPFSLGGKRVVYHLVRGQRDGRPFTFWTQGWWASRALAKPAKHRDHKDKHDLAVATVDLDGARPVLDILTHRIGDDEFAPLGQKLSDHPGLPGVAIFGDDQAYAGQVLTDDLVARIAAQPEDGRINLRVAEGAAIAWGDPVNQGCSEWRELIDTAEALAAGA